MAHIYIPNHIPEYFIYDIFYNGIGELIILVPNNIPVLKIQYLDNNNSLDFSVNLCPYNHTHIYFLKTEHKENITLSINNNIVYTYVNKYPDFDGEIIYSTLVKNEDKYIIQWIEYHYKIGITRFIIYDNSEENTLIRFLKKYIEDKIVILIKWTYPYLTSQSGFTAQITQQNHSVYAFKTSKYIGLFDIDEYLNIQQVDKYTTCARPVQINDMFEKLIAEENIDVMTISSFRLLNKFFYNPNNLPTNDSEFINIFNCDSICNCGHEKNFIIPMNVKTVSVHIITSGLPFYTVNDKYVFFNHYYFLNKNWRGTNVTNLTDNSILNHTKPY